MDIGDRNLLPVQALAEKLPSEQAQVRTLALEVPPRNELFSSLRRYREFLKLEFPRYYWNPNYEPWLPEDIELPRSGEDFPRALAKAIYGINYYDGEKILDRELADFAGSVDQTRLPSMVLVCFGMGEGTGSGMVVDLARHLSSVKLGRRIPVWLGWEYYPAAATQKFPAAAASSLPLMS